MAERLADVGPGGFYTPGQFVDYPPGYLYLLWAIGKVSASPGYLLLKLPSIICDLALAGVSGVLAARLAPRPLLDRMPVRTLVIAAVLFNPAVVGVSAGWGQVDVVSTFFVVTSLLLLYTGMPSVQRDGAVFFLFAIAVAIKPRSGFVLPVMLYALYRRYLHRKARAELLDGVLACAVIGGVSFATWAVRASHWARTRLDPAGSIESPHPSTPSKRERLQPVGGLRVLACRFEQADDRDEPQAPCPSSASTRRRSAHFSFLVALGYVLWKVHRAIEQGRRRGADPSLRQLQPRRCSRSCC